ncbi:nuclear transport factor 2 family protein [Deinococcus pimensis]|uniref:nuclear transport factor 2 family protein n=1 Tax=Deinococcus pimensis TaxID=309888 RepID=UPI0004B8D622|nr:nuclear transport factor 2 family protein [Deinococcus pimensis]
MTPHDLDPAELQRWLDDARIIRVVDRYFRALDDRQYTEATFDRVVTPDIRVIRPNGAVTVGRTAIVESHARSFTRFAATQHLLGGHDVDIEGATAIVRANLIAIHLWNDRPADANLQDRSFTAGGVVRAALRRTTEGWRISELRNDVTWRTGDVGSMRDTR